MCRPSLVMHRRAIGTRQDKSSGLCTQGVVGKLPELVELLDVDRAEGPDLTAPQDTPYGMLSPPLGQARLKAVEVLYSILGLSDPAAEQGMPHFHLARIS